MNHTIEERAGKRPRINYNNIQRNGIIARGNEKHCHLLIAMDQVDELENTQRNENDERYR